MRKLVSTAICVSVLTWACASNAASPFSLEPLKNLIPHRDPPPRSFVDVPYSTWGPGEPSYLLYPGDEIESVDAIVPSLNKVMIVGPDGRIVLPTGQPMQAGGRPIADIRAEAARTMMLRQPESLVLTVKPQPIKIYVGGEVKAPGEYALTGDDNALQAIMKAGGFSTSANTKRVQVIRRVAGGPNALGEVDLSQAFKHGTQPDLVPLARQDVIFVPRTGIANIGLAVQSFLAILPVTFSYSVNSLGR